MDDKDKPTEKRPKKVIVVSEDNDELVQENSSEKTVKKIPVSGDTPPVSEEEIADEKDATLESTDKKIEESEATQKSDNSQDDALPKDITIEEALASTQSEDDSESQDEQEELKDVSSSENESVTMDASSENEDSSESTEKEQEDDQESFNDETTKDAIDDIVATESDELLAHEDAEKEVELAPKAKKGNFWQRTKDWLKVPVVRWSIVGGIVVVITLLGVFPVTRYAILNAAGVRGGLSLTVSNSDNQQPLKNAEVIVAGQSKSTDEDGRVSFEKLKLGKTTIKISKRGYAPVEQSKTLGWGSNPIGDVKLAVSGSQFSFTVTDFLSQKAIANAEAESGEYNAQADKDGKIVLPLDTNNDNDIEVVIKAKGYREEKLTITAADTEDKKLQLVPSKQHVFVSKRTGKYDIYKIDADGKNEAVLMAATGTEREDISILPHPTKDYVAIVSSREGKRNKDGYLLSNVYVVNTKTGQFVTPTQSERIRLIDWTGDRVVYIAVTEGVSASNPARSKLFSFEIGQPGAKEIASANYFNDAVVFKDKVYFAPSSYSIPVDSVKYYSINPDGSDKKILLDKEVWNIFRTDFSTLLLTVQQEWYEQKDTAQPVKLSNTPANPKNRTYRTNPSGSIALWIDERDGKGVLLGLNTQTNKDEVLQTQGGLVLPLSWLNDTTYVYRISDGREVADYVKSIDGGEAKKLKDVTNTEQYNYYGY